MKCWVTYELRSISSMPHFNGLDTARAMKENKEGYFFLPSCTEAKKE